MILFYTKKKQNNKKIHFLFSYVTDVKKHPFSTQDDSYFLLIARPFKKSKSKTTVSAYFPNKLRRIYYT